MLVGPKEHNTTLVPEMLVRPQTSIREAQKTASLYGGTSKSGTSRGWSA